MPVRLLPPITSSLPSGFLREQGFYRDAVPLTEASRYIRGPGNSRWHRVRCAVQHGEFTHWSYWCGPASSFKFGGPALADEVPAGEPVCGTCVGRALGAGQDDAPEGLPSLRFDPRWVKPPRVCPGSGVQVFVRPLNARLSVGVCLVCGLTERIHARRGASGSSYALVRHAPGPDLIEPCPFHAWRGTYVLNDVVGCGWNQRKVVV